MSDGELNGYSKVAKEANQSCATVTDQAERSTIKSDGSVVASPLVRQNVARNVARSLVLLSHKLIDVLICYWGER